MKSRGSDLEEFDRESSSLWYLKQEGLEYVVGINRMMKLVIAHALLCRIGDGWLMDKLCRSRDLGTSDFPAARCSAEGEASKLEVGSGWMEL